jgi:hypothetical protein
LWGAIAAIGHTAAVARVGTTSPRFSASILHMGAGIKWSTSTGRLNDLCQEHQRGCIRHNHLDFQAGLL